MVKYKLFRKDSKSTTCCINLPQYYCFFYTILKILQTVINNKDKKDDTQIKIGYNVCCTVIIERSILYNHKFPR